MPVHGGPGKIYRLLSYDSSSPTSQGSKIFWELSVGPATKIPYVNLIRGPTERGIAVMKCSYLTSSSSRQDSAGPLQVINILDLKNFLVASQCKTIKLYQPINRTQCDIKQMHRLFQYIFISMCLSYNSRSFCHMMTGISLLHQHHSKRKFSQLGEGFMAAASLEESAPGNSADTATKTRSCQTRLTSCPPLPPPLLFGGGSVSGSSRWVMLRASGGLNPQRPLASSNSNVLVYTCI